MKIKQHEEMMKYLLRKKPEKVRTENMTERIQRMQHLYDDGPRPKHMDNKNIKSQEDIEKMKNKYYNDMLKKDKPKPFVKEVKPLKLDITGISDNLFNDKPEPVKPDLPKRSDKELDVGIASILGLPKKF